MEAAGNLDDHAAEQLSLAVHRGFIAIPSASPSAIPQSLFEMLNELVPLAWLSMAHKLGMLRYVEARQSWREPAVFDETDRKQELRGFASWLLGKSVILHNAVYHACGSYIQI